MPAEQKDLTSPRRSPHTKKKNSGTLLGKHLIISREGFDHALEPLIREKRCNEVATRAAPEPRRCWYLQEDNSGCNRKARFLFSISKKEANPPNEQYFSHRLLALNICPISSSTTPAQPAQLQPHELLKSPHSSPLS